jgi:signal peptidase
VIKYKEKYKKIGSLELSREILRRGKNLRIPIVGESMYPIFKRGDIIIIKPVKIEDLSVGDVVLYQSGKRMVAHRLIKKCINNGKMTFVMKGDSFPDFDPPVYPEDVIGKVIAIEREERTLRLDRGLNKLMNIFCAKISPFQKNTGN